MPVRALVAQRVVRALGIGGEHLADLARAHPRQVARERVDLGDGQPEARATIRTALRAVIVFTVATIATCSAPNRW